MKYIGKKRLFILVIVVIAVVLGNVVNVFAATSAEDLRKQQQQNQQQIEDAKNKQKEIRNQMTDIQRQVDELDSKISDYESDIYDLNSQIEEVSKNINSAEIELQKTQKDLEEKEDLLEKRLVASYKAGSTSYLDVLLDSDSLTSFLSSYYLVEQISENDTKLINTVKDTKQQIENSKAQLEENRASLENIKQAEVAKKSELDATKKEKEQAVANLSNEDKEVQSKIDEMRSEDSKIRAAIAKAEREASRTSSRGNGGSRSSSSNPGGFIYPVPAAYSKVTSGMYYSGSKRYHGAYDFGSGGIAGQPVYAVKDGTVIYTANLTNSYGTHVIIRHSSGLYTLYAHGQAGSLSVSVGQKVSQGQQIMRVGSTGNSTGAHLHFEVRVGSGGYGDRVNPGAYLP